MKSTIFRVAFLFSTLLLLVASKTVDAGVALQAAGTHIVQPGETLSSIATRYGVSVAQLQAANNLPNPNQIRTGTTLIIPGIKTSGASNGASYNPTPLPTPMTYAPLLLADSSSAGCGTVYIVRRNEWLSMIAARCGVTVEALIRANGLTPLSFIYPGQRLIIPVPGAYLSPPVYNSPPPPYVAPTPRTTPPPSGAPQNTPVPPKKTVTPVYTYPSTPFIHPTIAP